MVAVIVLGHVEALHPVIAGTRSDDRNLALERHIGLQDCRLAADFLEGCSETGGLREQGLTLAVVAEPPGFQHRRASDAIERARKVSRAVDPAEWRGCDAEAGDELLLDQPVLRSRQHGRI